MIHKLYATYNLPFSHELCHLYEHLIHQRFAQALKEHGMHRAVVGYVNATTAESSIFFDTGFYTATIAALWESTLADQQPFSKAAIQTAICHIETELKAIASISDEATLVQQLANCHALFQQSSHKLNPATTPAAAPLQFTPRPDSFTDISLTIESPDASNKMTAAFFCLATVLIDIVYDACIKQMPLYPQSASDVIAYKDGTAVTQTYSIHSSDDWHAIAAAAEHSLHSFDASAHTSLIAAIAELFRSHPFYTAAPIDFYQKTLTPANANYLASTVTTSTLQKILRTATVHIQKME